MNAGRATGIPPGAGRDGGASSGAAQYLRRTTITYPGPASRRIVKLGYASSGVGAMVNRLDKQTDNAGTTVYAQYHYLGAGTIYKVTHPAVASGGGLTLSFDPAPDQSFTVWDRFGRTVVAEVDQPCEEANGAGLSR